MIMNLNFKLRRSLPSQVIPGLLRRFSGDTGGVTAMEFALILPLMVMIYLMALDITMILTADRRVTNISSAIGDLVGQTKEITNAEMQDIFLAASAIIDPMPSGSLSIVVTSVVSDDDNITTVDWSDALNGGAATAGAAITVPAGLTEPNSSVIVATAVYTYASPASQFLTGASIVLDETFYLKPRRTTQVERVP